MTELERTLLVDDEIGRERAEVQADPQVHGRLDVHEAIGLPHVLAVLDRPQQQHLVVDAQVLDADAHGEPRQQARLGRDPPVQGEPVAALAGIRREQRTAAVEALADLVNRGFEEE